MDQNLAVSKHGGCSVVVVALVLSFACGQIVSQFTFDHVKKVTSILVENSMYIYIYRHLGPGGPGGAGPP